MSLWNSRKLLIMFTLLVACVAFSCRRNPPAAATATPPPPPPPPPAVAAPTITLTATPATITAGQQATLVWEATNATAVVIEPEIGTVVAKGNQAVAPQSSVTYTARASGPGGNAQAIQRVTVNAVPPATASATGVPTKPTVTATLADIFQKEIASQPVLFDYDSSEIRADQIGKLQSHAQWLKRNGSVRVSIQGHADERGSQEYNVALGDERAASVMKYLVAQGVPGSQLATVSFGEEKPVCHVQDEACFQQNRRANLEMAN